MPSHRDSMIRLICGGLNGCGAVQPTRYIREGIGKVFAEASNMLKIALDASDAKTKAKLQQIDLMLKKARIDKFSDKGGETESIQATVFDRNDLLKIIKGDKEN